jgi:hypothetical protein
MPDIIAIDLEPWRRRAAARKVPVLDSLILSVIFGLLIVGDGSNQAFLMLSLVGAFAMFVCAICFFGPIPRILVAPLRNLLLGSPVTYGEIDPRCCRVRQPLTYFNATVSDVRQRLRTLQASLNRGMPDTRSTHKRLMRASGILLVVTAIVLIARMLFQGNADLLEVALGACAGLLGVLLIVTGTRLSASTVSIPQVRLARQFQFSVLRWSALGLLFFPGCPVALLAVVAVIADTIPATKSLQGPAILLFCIVFFAGFIAAIKCVRRARDALRISKQAVLPTMAQLTNRDDRKPILLLRSFSDDQVELDRHRREVWGPSESQRFEEVIKEHLAPYGPLIAVGKPGSLPEFGATRAYLGEASWQAQVIEWMDQALLIVVILGRTPWLRWEIEQILSRGHLNKAVFLLPPGTSRPARWRAFVECFEGSPWAASLESAASMPIRTVYCASGQAVVLTSENGQTVDYALAMHLASYGLLLHERESEFRAPFA